MGSQESGEGRYFEDFALGELFEHKLGRTVLAADNVWFTLAHGEPESNPL